jgi:hypothetical protein
VSPRNRPNRQRGARSLVSALTLLTFLPASLLAGEPAGHWTDGLSTGLQFFRQWLHEDLQTTLPIKDHLVSVSSELAALTFDLERGGNLKIALDHGRVLVDDAAVGRYQPGGALELAWRQLVTDASRRPTTEVVALVHGWQPGGLTHEEAIAAEQMRKRLDSVVSPQHPEVPPQAVQPAAAGGLVIDLSDLSNPAALEPRLRQAAALSGPDLRLTIPNGRARLGHFSVGSGENLTGHLLVLHGDADIYGMLAGNVAAVEGDVIVHPGAVVTGDVLALGGDVKDAGGEIRGQIRTLRPAVPSTAAAAPAEPALSPLAAALRRAVGLTGVFSTLTLLGFGLVLFGKQPLEVVSDTVMHSFGRSFVVGLLGQILLLPTFGMLVVGLILSVAGILLLPFAVVAYVLLVVVAVLGGYLAVAHAMGETYTRRRMALGAVISSPNSYRYVAVGLGGLLALWAAWVVFGWVPVAGSIIRAVAVLVTWLLATTGLGAALLSRAGLREGFAGRLLPQESLTDEYLWATPQFGVPAAKRPGTRTPPPIR